MNRSGDIRDIPIDPAKRLRDYWEGYFREERSKAPENHLLTATRHFGMKSESFVGVLELVRAISDGVRWDKKCRVVVEYDPEKEKVSVTTFMESGEDCINPYLPET